MSNLYFRKDVRSNIYVPISVPLWRSFYVVIFFTAIMLVSPELWNVISGSINDAYIGVTTFVALTLGLLYGLEKIAKIDFATFISRYPKAQIIIASALGSLPGCGGAVMVVTQYVKGGLTFGALTATLVSTMGDAAFILLAAQPRTGFIVIGVGFFVGIITGYITDMFPVPKVLSKEKEAINRNKSMPAPMNPAFWKPLDYLWLGLMIPGVFLGIGAALQYDMNLVIDPSGETAIADNIAIFGGILAMITFLSAPKESMPHIVHMNPETKLRRRVVAETSFITLWVVLGFALYDVAIYLTGYDLEALFQTVGPLVPLLGVLIGWLPGCGPQILTTALYVNGTIPMSALLGNAISNDGDALFPALSLSPKAALYATFYSTIPALILSYTYYLVFQN